jgi:hypothetical protein
MDEGRVRAELSGELVDGLLASEGGEGDLGLEGRRVLLTLPRHVVPLSQTTRLA